MYVYVYTHVYMHTYLYIYTCKYMCCIYTYTVYVHIRTYSWAWFCCHFIFYLCFRSIFENQLNMRCAKSSTYPAGPEQRHENKSWRNWISMWLSECAWNMDSNLRSRQSARQEKTNDTKKWCVWGLSCGDMFSLSLITAFITKSMFLTCSVEVIISAHFWFHILIHEAEINALKSCFIARKMTHVSHNSSPVSQPISWRPHKCTVGIKRDAGRNEQRSELQFQEE